MWHYIENGATLGPVAKDDIEQLIRDGVINGNTLVWKEGMATWQDARSAGLVVDLLKQPPPPPPPKSITLGVSSSAADRRTLSILVHVLGLFTGIIGTVVMLLVSEDAVVKAHARAALNWQISLLIYLFVAFVLVFVLIGIPLLIGLLVIDLIFCIMAAVKASENTLWQYPLSIPFFTA